MGGMFGGSTGSIAQAAEDIAATMSRIDGLRDELERDVILRLRALWAGEASDRWNDVQTEWNEASLAVNELLMRIGQHTGTSAEEFLNAEVSNIATWTR